MQHNFMKQRKIQVSLRTTANKATGKNSRNHTLTILIQDSQKLLSEETKFLNSSCLLYKYSESEIVNVSENMEFIILSMSDIGTWVYTLKCIQ